MNADGSLLRVAIPDPALVVLVGPSGSGKSSWAAARYLAREIASSDQLRAVVGSGEHDLDASADAFSLLDQIVAARARRGLAVVVDTLGLDQDRRRQYLALARAADLPAVAVVFSTSATVCRTRNRERDVPVPATVLTAQLRRMRGVLIEVADEGWDFVIEVSDEDAAARLEHRPAPSSVAASDDRPMTPGRLEFILQISRFEWDPEPAAWLKSMALAATDAGFTGVALMDHLLQIPQVGRPWDPIPEPWVSLGLLAGLDTNLKLGTLVSPVTFRPPGVVAKTVATLDVLSGGRAFCGIGAGWWDREHAGFGLPFPPAKERLDRLEVAIETMRALWQPGTKAYASERVNLPETTCYPRPVSRVPIIVGGGGEKRTLQIAARLADGCNVPSDLAVVDAKVAVLREHCEQAGRDPGEVAITVLDLPVIGRDREEVAGIIERLRGRTSATAFAKRHHAGVAADHIARYRQLADRGVSLCFVALPDLTGPADLARMEPVIAALA